ncbi:MAG TPA: RNA polymerase sigma factor SigJ [Candidatus Limnocylindrales bacterium]
MLDRRAFLTDEFERQRPYLRSVAYRMLGSVSEAEDALQECWLRLDRRGPAETDNLRPWLTTVVGRICLDILRARRSRREDYAGTWLPEPIEVTADDEASPEHEAVLADSIGLALLVVLEALSPAERLAFVLHDVFAVPFDEIAGVVGRTPEATRQLASRARRRVRAEKHEPDADLAVQRRVVDAFLAAARARDFDGLLAVLDPDVVMRFDGGGRGPLARPSIVGAANVAREIDQRGRSFAVLGRPAIVNGSAGVIVGSPGHVVAVTSMVVVDGRIRAIDVVGDPAKLRAVGLA